MFIALFMAMLLPASASHALSDAKHRILILNSYHEEFRWTENQVSAAKEVLSKGIKELELFVEYMDTKRVYNKEYLDYLYHIYRLKYQRVRLSAIITTDDNALWFVEKHHKELFQQAPVFFSGVNDHGKVSAGNPNFTGLLEVLDVKPTIDLALELHPQTRTIVVLVDNTPTGIGQKKVISDAAARYNHLKFEYIEAKDVSHKELFEKLRRLPSDCFVLLAVWLRDKNEVYLSPGEGGRRISSNAAVPVYGIIDMYLGHGIVGGKILSSRTHGRIVAEETVRAIHGRSSAPASMASKSINPYMFDYKQLERWQISISRLPEESIVINQPVSFYAQNKQLIWTIFGVFSFLITAVVILLLNIVGRRNAEQELRESEEKYRLIFENSPIGIATVDLFGRFVATNPAYEQMMGYSKEELGKMSFFDLTHPDYLAEYERLFREIFSKESDGFRVEKKSIRKDGAHIHVSVNAKPVINENGDATFGTAFIEDITERIQSELEITQSKRLVDSVINGIAEPIFVKDEAYRWVMVNDAFCGMFGKRRDELIGKSDYDLFSENEASTLGERDKLVMRSGRTDIHEENLTIGEQKRIVSICKSIFINPITGSGNIVGIVRDITDAKHIEKQLQRARKMESIGRLAGGVAHDFNNMLSIIIGYSELALEKLHPDDPIYDEIREILTAGNRSADITRQLLAFARQQTTAPRVLDLNESIEGMLKMLRRLIGEDVDLVWRPGSEVWPVNIDPSQIDQILANLCVNARDAISGVGQVVIETKNTTFDEEYCASRPGFVPGEYVMLAVSDNGSGISQELIDKIFEPFFTTKGLHQGTGLGLSTVYGIVQQNNGFINVYSEKEKGTTIKSYFPKHTGQKDMARPKSPRKNPLSHGETVLLVDDDKSVLKLGERMLHNLGYTVLSAATPGEAIKIGESHMGKINLLITDVVMPEMNGRELSEHLLHMDPDLKTLYMSGYTANVIAHRGVLEDGVSFISKPLSKKELSVKVREVLDSY